jgi:hypothetical protein
MRRNSNEFTSACERLLAIHLVDVATELREVDAADLVVWIHGNRLGNIASIVASCLEPAFKPGTLRFAISGGIRMTWSGLTEARIDMEFHYLGIDCYFALHIGDSSAGVDIEFLGIDGATCRSPDCVERFQSALNGARLDRRSRIFNGRGTRKPDTSEAS